MMRGHLKTLAASALLVGCSPDDVPKVDREALRVASDHRASVEPVLNQVEVGQIEEQTSPEPNHVSNLVLEDASSSPIKTSLLETIAPFEGVKWVGNLEGNGNRPVVIYVPSTLNPDRPIEVVYHFHGTHSHMPGQPYEVYEGCSDQIKGWVREGKKAEVGNDRLRQVMTGAYQAHSHNRNVIVIYPLSNGRRPNTNEKYPTAWKNDYDALWFDKSKTEDDINQLDAELQTVLVNDMGLNLSIQKRTAVGHSAGGRALVNTADWEKWDEMRWEDASYRGWGTKAANKAKEAGLDYPVIFFYVPGQTTEGEAKVARGLLGDSKVSLVPVHCAHGDIPYQYFNWKSESLR